MNQFLELHQRPSDAFRHLGRKPMWGLAWLTMAVVQGTLSLLPFPSWLEGLPQFDRTLVISSLLLNPGLTLLIQIAILAAMLWFVGTVTGLRLEFKHWYSILMWSFLPVGFVGILIRTAIRSWAGIPYVFFGPALLLPPESKGMLKVVLTSLDLFTLWTLGLVFLGTYVTRERRSKPVGVAAAATVYFAFFFLTSYQVWR